VSVEWAEFEIRRLPGVYACIATPSEVAVLVEPGADTEAVTESAATILALLGIDQTLRVLGGGQEVVPRPSFGHKVPAAVGVGGLVAVVLAGTVAALTGGVFGVPSQPPRAPVIPFPAAAAPPPTLARPIPAHTTAPHVSASPPAVAVAAAPVHSPGVPLVPFVSVSHAAATAPVISHLAAVAPIAPVAAAVLGVAPPVVPAVVALPATSSIAPATQTVAFTSSDAKASSKAARRAEHASDLRGGTSGHDHSMATPVKSRHLTAG
jgi:hypothetical protein